MLEFGTSIANSSCFILGLFCICLYMHLRMAIHFTHIFATERGDISPLHLVANERCLKHHTEKVRRDV